MLPRSLQNFMNAFTSSHYTLYPFATTNSQDFKNLMAVYLDATLHPLLKKSDFVQEGWRIGPENPKVSTDADGVRDLVFKGVVYNEMKGMTSDASYLYYVKYLEHIFPAINNSGGDPQKMTDLTYEQLRNFHQTHYHPSNSKIMTYGDQPVEHHLQLLGEQLGRFSRSVIDHEVKRPASLQGPKNVTVPGPLDPLTPPDAQYKTSTTWLFGDTGDIHESFALSLASSLLLDGYGSPMYRDLIEAGLGTDFSPNTGYDNSGRQAVFSIGLNGVTKANVSKVKETIVATLQKTIDRGFDQHKVDGILHQLELGIKHKTASFGMNLIQRMNPGWFNGIDPFEGLSWNVVVDRFKSNFAKGGYLEGLLKKYASVDDTLTFTMAPSEDYAAAIVAEETNRLQVKIAETVSKFPNEHEAYGHLRECELELVAEQDAGQTQDLDSLPTLHISDIPRIQKTTQLRDSTTDARTKVQWRETATNGLTYFRALSLFENLPDELRMLVPLFCDSLMRIGTRQRSMEQLEDLIKLKTGGISFGYHTSTSPDDILRSEEGFSLSGYAFDGNVSAMYELLQTVLIETDFDSPKAQTMIKQLLQSGASGAVDAIAESGHRYARKYVAAGLTPEGKFAEQTSGMTQIKLIASLASAEDDADAMQNLITQLKDIQAIAVSNMATANLRVALTCGVDASAPNETALQRFLTSVKHSSSHLSTSTVADPVPARTYPSTGRTIFPLPYQVSYTALSLSTAPYTSKSGAALAVLAPLLTHNFLHHEIREKGGAYGGGAANSGQGGTFGMYSYRDPNPANTMTIYSRAARWAAERQWTDREMEEAKLSVFQQADAPISVNREGMSRFLSGIDDAMEQQRREWLLDVNARDVQAAAETLATRIQNGEDNIVMLGEKKSWLKDEEWRVEDMGSASRCLQLWTQVVELNPVNPEESGCELAKVSRFRRKWYVDVSIYTINKLSKHELLSSTSILIARHASPRWLRDRSHLVIRRMRLTRTTKTERRPLVIALAFAFFINDGWGMPYAFRSSFPYLVASPVPDSEVGRQ
nr:mitochondrial presequence protease [Quercus suber]